MWIEKEIRNCRAEEKINKGIHRNKRFLKIMTYSIKLKGVSYVF